MGGERWFIYGPLEPQNSEDPIALHTLQALADLAPLFPWRIVGRLMIGAFETNTCLECAAPPFPPVSFSRMRIVCGTGTNHELCNT